MPAVIPPAPGERQNARKGTGWPAELSGCAVLSTVPSAFGRPLAGMISTQYRPAGSPVRRGSSLVGRILLAATLIRVAESGSGPMLK
jgi:hypothetical protein